MYILVNMIIKIAIDFFIKIKYLDNLELIKIDLKKQKIDRENLHGLIKTIILCYINQNRRLKAGSQPIVIRVYMII